MSTSCGVADHFSTIENDAPVPNHRPVLIYDGQCGFCTQCAMSWEKRSQGRLDVMPYQDLKGRLPEATPENCARALHLAEPIDAGVRISKGSAAAIRSHLIACGRQPDRGVYATLVPLLSVLLHLPYCVVAKYRGFFNRFSPLIFGQPKHSAGPHPQSDEPNGNSS